MKDDNHEYMMGENMVTNVTRIAEPSLTLRTKSFRHQRLMTTLYTSLVIRF